MNRTSRNGSLVVSTVGLPRDISWRGETVHTSVWKNPVQGRRLVRQLNVDGDAQGDLAGHGGEHRAVLVYQIDSHEYWERQLCRKNLTFGQFGENFTVEEEPEMAAFPVPHHRPGFYMRVLEEGEVDREGRGRARARDGSRNRRSLVPAGTLTRTADALLAHTGLESGVEDFLASFARSGRK